MNDYTQRRLEEFEKLVEHDDDFNCAAHSEGKYCCLDKGEKRHDKIKSFLSTSIHQAEQEMLKRVVEKINEAKKGYVGQQYRYGKEALDDLLSSLDKALPDNKE